MTDPISAEMASQAAQNYAEIGEVDGAEPSKNFADTMDAQSDEAKDAEAADGVDADFAVDEVNEVEEVEAPSEIPTDDFIQSLLGEEDQIQAMMEDCLGGGSMEQEDMLQMQAVIYSYSQRMDLTTKVVENATSGIKQVMNTQV